VRVRSYSGTGTSELSTPVSGGGGEWRIGSQEHGAPRDLRFPPDSRVEFVLLPGVASLGAEQN